MTAKHPVYRIPSCLDLELFDRVAIFYCDAYYIWRATGVRCRKKKRRSVQMKMTLDLDVPRFDLICASRRRRSDCTANLSDFIRCAHGTSR